MSRLWAEVRYYLFRRPLIEAQHAAVCAGYWIRPYDMLLDARRWFWQPRGRCQGGPQTMDELVRRLREGWRP